MSGVSPMGFPAAAGGVDVPTSVLSSAPGIRRLKKIMTSTNLTAGFTGGTVQFDLPKSSYLARMVIRVSGNLQIRQPASADTFTQGDPRNFLTNMRFSLSGSTAPRVLNGLQADTIDNLDVAAVAANAQTYSIPTVAANNTGSTPFQITWTPRFTVSDQNLYGIPYLGAAGTVPQLSLTFADPQTVLAIPVSRTGATITLESGLIEIEGWRIDLPAPVLPQEIVTYDSNGNPQRNQVPGQGLYHEASYMILTRMFDQRAIVAAGAYNKFRLPIGPDYLRIIVLAYQNNVLDTESSPLIDHTEVVVQQAVAIESRKIWQHDNEYRQTYNKARPSGVYVMSGIDLTGTDADLYVTRELGNFDIDVYGSGNAPAANSRLEVITQEIVPLSTPGQYL